MKYENNDREIRYVPDYDINEKTLLILPHKDIEYESKVFEPNIEYYVKRKPLELLEQSCLDNGSNLQGRIDFVRSRLGQRNKVPVLIKENQPVVASPTHSPKNPECQWIFTTHISDSKQYKNSGKNGTLVTFKDRSMIFLNIPKSQFSIMVNRAHMCHGLMRYFLK
ncbi:competence protein ComK [Alkalicoccobacillus porphyridii]|uniref:Competence protein n=1 Tax=Alkalicoccobacillus porphyridii TaxID=2597270 RepID=A0A554A4F8_9BACI|nr:competence protein ComK [Alkalicoccobacillus porphyridii]TSB48579.1 hypothetical protein FN960_03230 [Alkalicoccobacillus porphyridii]